MTTSLLLTQQKKFVRISVKLLRNILRRSLERNKYKVSLVQIA